MMSAKNQRAPLREIIATQPGPPVVLALDKVEGCEGFAASLRTVVHTLACGHMTEPYIRDGCRVPPLPKRRRCQECLKEARSV